MHKLMSGLIACALLAGCNGGGGGSKQFNGNQSELTPGQTDTATRPTGNLTDTEKAVIIAKACPFNMTCDFMPAPKDYDDPNGDMVDIFYGVHKAEDPANRIGALILNFGGPSAEAVRGAGDMAEYNLPQEILDRFDIVGIDPRGAGQSAFAGELTECAVAEDQGRGNCDATYQQIAPYLGSNSVVKDIDRLREQLGDEKLTFLGYSYGTRLGSLYAHTFPDRVRAIVLDSPMSPTAANNVDIRVGNAAGYEKIADYRLGHNSDRNTRYQDIVDQLFSPERAYNANDGVLRQDTGEAVMHFTVASDSSELWPWISDGLKELLDNDRLQKLNAALSGNQPGYVNSRYSSYADDLRGNALFKAVVCTDESNPLTDYQMISSEERYQRGSSLYGTLIYKETSGLCMGWTAQRDPIAAVTDMDIKLSGQQILIIGGQYDPATPYTWAEEMKASFGSSASLVTIDNYVEHGFSYSGTECIDQSTTAYLLDPSQKIAEKTCDKAAHRSGLVFKRAQRIPHPTDNVIGW